MSSMSGGENTGRPELPARKSSRESLSAFLSRPESTPKRANASEASQVGSSRQESRKCSTATS